MRGQLFLLIIKLLMSALGESLLDDIDIYDITNDMHPSEFTRESLGKMYLPQIYDSDDDDNLIDYKDVNSQRMARLLSIKEYSQPSGIKVDEGVYQFLDESFFEKEIAATATYKYGSMWPGSEKDPLSEDEKTIILDLHNLYRTNLTVPGADIEWMVWHQGLENSAQEYASMCIFERGFPPHSYKPSLGQNLYLGSESPDRAMWLWYIEYLDFDFFKWQCKPGADCGHLTQMYWYNSRNIGCARHKCWPEIKTYIIACHYWPPGNLLGKKGYTIGKACTRCSQLIGAFCYHNICITPDQCKMYNFSCDCELQCLNCGKLQRENCRCVCPDGWDYVDCGVRCRNKNRRCKDMTPSPEALRICPNNNNYTRDVQCRRMCNMCSIIDPNKKKEACCAGVQCRTGYKLNLKICRCELQCPGPQCITHTTATAPPPLNSWFFPTAFSYEYFWQQLLTSISWLFLLRLR